jgi:hypothetical protein
MIGAPPTLLERLRRRPARGHRPIFFDVEDRGPFTGCRLVTVGLQSVLRPANLDTTLRRRPKLREAKPQRMTILG